MSHVVTVVFRAKPEHRDAFRQAMVENATASRTREPGCRQFDVCESADGAEIFLYEIYDDEAAFETHKATAHFRAFAEATKTSIVGRNVTRLLVEDDSRAAPDMLPA